MNLKEYLEKSNYSTEEILAALCDGEFLSKFNITQDEVEELFDYYQQKKEAV